MSRVKVGDTVTIVAGRWRWKIGVVTWEGIDGSCGCRSVIVRTPDGEWFGKRSEIRNAT